jgi:hypothetical protein
MRITWQQQATAEMTCQLQMVYMTTQLLAHASHANHLATTRRDSRSNTSAASGLYDHTTPGSC